MDAETGTPHLNAALAKVQARLPKLERDRTVTVTQKNGETYSYSYVTLSNLSDGVLPLLTEHGLAFVAMPGAGSDGKMCLRYRLLHESGESLAGEFPISGEGGIQMIGGRITYARRYCLAALVGVAADEDDESRLSEGDGPKTAQRAAARPRPQRADGDAPPAGRTAQRAQRPTASGRPPLPGEDGAATTPQMQKLAIHLGEIGVEDRAERLNLCGRYARRELASAKDLTQREATGLIDLVVKATTMEAPLAWLTEQLAGRGHEAWPEVAQPADGAS
jgi:hypothetical protein